MPKVQIKRTVTPGLMPSGLSPGELAIEMATPTRLWIGVPHELASAGQKLLFDSSAHTLTEAPLDGQTYGRRNSGWIPVVGSVNPSDFVAKVGDTMTGALRISHLASPTVGALMLGSGSAHIISDGVTMSIEGVPLRLAVEPSAADHAATKAYVDTFFSKGGGTITGPTSITAATAASSPITGALTVSGGVGVGKQVWMNGSLLVLPILGQYAFYRDKTVAAWIEHRGPGSNYGLVIMHTENSTTVGQPSQDMLFINASGASVGSINTTESGVALVSSSDGRLKHDLQPFRSSHARAIIDMLKIYNYAWRNSDERGIGVVAQEANNVFPMMVSKGDPDSIPPDRLKTPWGTDYSKLVPVLVADAQDVHARLDQIERKLDLKNAA